MKEFNVARVLARKKKGDGGLFDLVAVNSEGEERSLTGTGLGREGKSYLKAVNEFLTDGTIPGGVKEFEGFETCQAVVLMRDGQPIGLARINKA